MNKMITVIGLGNLLLGDDGIGPLIVEELQKAGLPKGVNAVVGEGSLYQYWNIIAESKKILIVDALQAGNVPGTVCLLKVSPIKKEEPAVIFRHEDDFLGALDFISCFEERPEVMVIGVEPKQICYSLELSSEVKARIPQIIKMIREAITAETTW